MSKNKIKDLEAQLDFATDVNNFCGTLSKKHNVSILNIHKKWRDYEDSFLLRSICDLQDIANIRKTIQRTNASIRNRILRMIGEEPIIYCDITLAKDIVKKYDLKHGHCNGKVEYIIVKNYVSNSLQRNNENYVCNGLRWNDSDFQNVIIDAENKLPFDIMCKKYQRSEVSIKTKILSNWEHINLSTSEIADYLEIPEIYILVFSE
ncbi:MAG TPA: hypothetical protein V6C58_17480 [Allocoleopsis sp.]